jgi:hypothetical protein
MSKTLVQVLLITEKETDRLIGRAKIKFTDGKAVIQLLTTGSDRFKNLTGKGYGLDLVAHAMNGVEWLGIKFDGSGNIHQTLRNIYNVTTI